MEKIIINGGKQLNGTVHISGSKNSALPIMAATLLTDEICTINNIAGLKDIDTMTKLLETLGKKITKNKSQLTIKTISADNVEAPYELVKQMRASICVLGPLLAKRKQAKVSFPGGCVIGPRPIDLHLKVLSDLKSDLNIEHGFICASAKKLIGSNINLKGKFGSSVLGTANAIMASCLAEGETIINHAACEPEIIDLVSFLKKMGAKIQGEGTPIIKIQGVANLSGTTHTIIPDRIETGTYLIAGAITGGELLLKNTEPKHLEAVISKLREAGQIIEIEKKSIKIKGDNKNIKPLNITTEPYPGFPTDMQAQFTSLLCFAKGQSSIIEKIYPDRFTHISELNRLGANILFDSGKAIINGVDELTGAEVMASDLRASAGLVLAGLAAQGQTTIQRIYHLDRGYENKEQKLTNIGADIIRSKNSEVLRTTEQNI